MQLCFVAILCQSECAGASAYWSEMYTQLHSSPQLSEQRGTRLISSTWPMVPTRLALPMSTNSLDVDFSTSQRTPFQPLGELFEFGSELLNLFLLIFVPSVQPLGHRCQLFPSNFFGRCTVYSCKKRPPNSSCVCFYCCFRCCCF